MSFSGIRENKILAKISESTVAKHTVIVTKAEGNIKVNALPEGGGLDLVSLCWKPRRQVLSSHGPYYPSCRQGLYQPRGLYINLNRAQTCL